MSAAAALPPARTGAVSCQARTPLVMSSARVMATPVSQARKSLMFMFLSPFPCQYALEKAGFITDGTDSAPGGGFFQNVRGKQTFI